MAREGGAAAACNFDVKTSTSAFAPSHRAWLETVRHAANVLSSSGIIFIRFDFTNSCISDNCRPNAACDLAFVLHSLTAAL